MSQQPRLDCAAVWAIGAGLAATAALLTGCTSSTQHGAVDLAILSARTPPAVDPRRMPAGYLLLAGDLHCHVAPPDWPPHVIRGLPETARTAEREGLDFVVLTPHVWAHFAEDDALRARVLGGQVALREAVAALPPGRTRFITGFEYTDGRFGHVGASFADLERVLAGLPAAELRLHPERFFEAYVREGGLLVINHPFTTPINFFVRIAREDLSWRPFTAPGPVTPEIAAVARLAQAYEAYNVTTTEVRDRFFYFDAERSLRKSLDFVDGEASREGRRMTPVGGSDSHSHTLYATTYILSEGRGEAEIRDAIVAGRSCVRDPHACSFEARGGESGWKPVGASIKAAEVEARATGNDIEVYRDGELVGRPRTGEPLRVAIPGGRCTLLRARVDGGFSAPVYLNCPF